VRVRLHAAELLEARERRPRPPRVPVVPVGHQHRPVSRGPGATAAVTASVPVGGTGPGRRGDVPAAAGRRHPHHLGVERDLLAQPEVVDVVVEVRGDLHVVGVVRQRRRHRVAGVLHDLARGVDVQRPVRRGHPVVVAVAPVPADPRARLEAVERDAAGVEHLAGRDAGGPSADDADPIHPPLPGVRTRRRPARCARRTRGRSLTMMTGVRA
jgi:hypothetical protein